MTKPYRIPKRCSISGCDRDAIVEFGRGVPSRPRVRGGNLLYRLCWVHGRGGLKPEEKKSPKKLEAASRSGIARRVLLWLTRR